MMVRGALAKLKPSRCGCSYYSTSSESRTEGFNVEAFNPSIKNPVTYAWAGATGLTFLYIWSKTRTAAAEPLPPRVDPRLFLAVPPGMGASVAAGGGGGQQRDYGGKIM